MRFLITLWIVFIYAGQELRFVVAPTLGYLLSLQRQSKASKQQTEVKGADAELLFANEQVEWEKTLTRAEKDATNLRKNARLKFSPLPQKMAVNVGIWQANKQRAKWAESILRNGESKFSQLFR